MSTLLVPPHFKAVVNSSLKNFFDEIEKQNILSCLVCKFDFANKTDLKNHFRDEHWPYALSVGELYFVLCGCSPSMGEACTPHYHCSFCKERDWSMTTQEALAVHLGERHAVSPCSIRINDEPLCQRVTLEDFRQTKLALLRRSRCPYPHANLSQMAARWDGERQIPQVVVRSQPDVTMRKRSRTAYNYGPLSKRLKASNGAPLVTDTDPRLSSAAAETSFGAAEPSCRAAGPIPAAASPIPAAASPIPAAASLLSAAASSLPAAASPVIVANSPIIVATSPLIVAAHSIPATTSPLPTAPSILSTGVCPLQTGASQLQTGASSLQTAPRSLPTAPRPLPTAPSTLPTAPSPLPTAPSIHPTGVTTLPTAPSPLPTAPSIHPTGVSTLPTAPSTLPTAPSTLPTGASPLSAVANPLLTEAHPLPVGASPLLVAPNPLPAAANPLSATASSLPAAENPLIAAAQPPPAAASPPAAPSGSEAHSSGSGAGPQSHSLYMEPQPQEVGGLSAHEQRLLMLYQARLNVQKNNQALGKMETSPAAEAAKEVQKSPRVEQPAPELCVYVNGRRTSIGCITQKYAAIVASRILNAFISKHSISDSKLRHTPAVSLRLYTLAQCQAIIEASQQRQRERRVASPVVDDDVIEIPDSPPEKPKPPPFRIKPLSSLMDPEVHLHPSPPVVDVLEDDPPVVPLPCASPIEDAPPSVGSAALHSPLGAQWVQAPAALAQSVVSTTERRPLAAAGPRVLSSKRVFGIKMSSAFVFYHMMQLHAMRTEDWGYKHPMRFFLMSNKEKVMATLCNRPRTPQHLMLLRFDKINSWAKAPFASTASVSHRVWHLVLGVQGYHKQPGSRCQLHFAWVHLPTAAAEPLCRPPRVALKRLRSCELNVSWAQRWGVALGSVALAKMQTKAGEARERSRATTHPAASAAAVAPSACAAPAPQPSSAASGWRVAVGTGTPAGVVEAQPPAPQILLLTPLQQQPPLVTPTTLTHVPLAPRPVGPQPTALVPLAPRSVGPQPTPLVPLAPRPVGPQPTPLVPLAPRPVGPQPAPIWRWGSARPLHLPSAFLAVGPSQGGASSGPSGRLGPTSKGGPASFQKRREAQRRRRTKEAREAHESQSFLPGGERALDEARDEEGNIIPSLLVRAFLSGPPRAPPPRHEWVIRVCLEPPHGGAAPLEGEESTALSQTNSQSHDGSLSNFQSHVEFQSQPSSQSHVGSYRNCQSHDESQSDFQSQPNSQSYAGSQPNLQSYAGSQPNSQSYAGSQPNSQSYAGSQPNSQSYAGSQPNSQSYAGSQPNSQSYAGSQPNSQSYAGSQPNSQSQQGSTATTDTPDGGPEEVEEDFLSFQDSEKKEDLPPGPAPLLGAVEPGKKRPREAPPHGAHEDLPPGGGRGGSVRGGACPASKRRRCDPEASEALPQSQSKAQLEVQSQDASEEVQQDEDEEESKEDKETKEEGRQAEGKEEEVEQEKKEDKNNENQDKDEDNKEGEDEKEETRPRQRVELVAQAVHRPVWNRRHHGAPGHKTTYFQLSSRVVVVLQRIGGSRAAFKVLCARAGVQGACVNRAFHQIDSAAKRRAKQRTDDIQQRRLQQAKILLGAYALRQQEFLHLYLLGEEQPQDVPPYSPKDMTYWNESLLAVLDDPEYRDMYLLQTRQLLQLVRDLRSVMKRKCEGSRVLPWGASHLRPLSAMPFWDLLDKEKVWDAERSLNALIRLKTTPLEALQRRQKVSYKPDQHGLFLDLAFNPYVGKPPLTVHDYLEMTSVCCDPDLFFPHSLLGQPEDTALSFVFIPTEKSPWEALNPNSSPPVLPSLACVRLDTITLNGAVLARRGAGASCAGVGQTEHRRKQTATQDGKMNTDSASAEQTDQRTTLAPVHNEVDSGCAGVGQTNQPTGLGDIKDNKMDSVSAAMEQTDHRTGPLTTHNREVDSNNAGVEETEENAILVDVASFRGPVGAPLMIVSSDSGETSSTIVSKRGTVEICLDADSENECQEVEEEIEGERPPANQNKVSLVNLDNSTDRDVETESHSPEGGEDKREAPCSEVPSQASEEKTDHEKLARIVNEEPPTAEVSSAAGKPDLDIQGLSAPVSEDAKDEDVLLVSTVPKVTFVVSDGATPVAGEAPVASGTPVAGEAPVSSATPVAGEAPVASATPVAGAAPVSSATPVAGEAPVASVAPVAGTTTGAGATSGVAVAIGATSSVAGGPGGTVGAAAAASTASDLASVASDLASAGVLGKDTPIYAVYKTLPVSIKQQMLLDICCNLILLRNSGGMAYAFRMAPGSESSEDPSTPSGEGQSTLTDASNLNKIDVVGNGLEAVPFAPVYTLSYVVPTQGGKTDSSHDTTKGQSKDPGVFRLSNSVQVPLLPTQLGDVGSLKNPSLLPLPPLPLPSTMPAYRTAPTKEILNLSIPNLVQGQVVVQQRSQGGRPQNFLSPQVVSINTPATRPDQASGVQTDRRQADSVITAQRTGVELPSNEKAHVLQNRLEQIQGRLKTVKAKPTVSYASFKVRERRRIYEMKRKKMKQQMENGLPTEEGSPLPPKRPLSEAGPGSAPKRACEHPVYELSSDEEGPPNSNGGFLHHAGGDKRSPPPVGAPTREIAHPPVDGDSKERSNGINSVDKVRQTGQDPLGGGRDSQQQKCPPKMRTNVSTSSSESQDSEVVLTGSESDSDCDVLLL